jgi:hypothetical protein
MRWHVTFAVEMDMNIDTDSVDIARRAEMEADEIGGHLYGPYGYVDVTVQNIDLIREGT